MCFCAAPLLLAVSKMSSIITKSCQSFVMNAFFELFPIGIVTGVLQFGCCNTERFKLIAPLI